MPHSLTVRGTALRPRGGPQEWAVDFDRKGSIVRCATRPELCFPCRSDKHTRGDRQGCPQRLRAILVQTALILSHGEVKLENQTSHPDFLGKSFSCMTTCG